MSNIKMDDMIRLLALGLEVDLYRKLKHAKQLRNAMADDHRSAIATDADPEVIDAIDRALCEIVDYVAELADQYEKQKSENARKGWS